MTTTHLHYFACPETAHGDYAGKHGDTTRDGAWRTEFRDTIVRRFPNHPMSKYVGAHRKASA